MVLFFLFQVRGGPDHLFCQVVVEGKIIQHQGAEPWGVFCFPDPFFLRKGGLFVDICPHGDFVYALYCNAEMDALIFGRIGRPVDAAAVVEKESVAGYLDPPVCLQVFSGIDGPLQDLISAGRGGRNAQAVLGGLFRKLAKDKAVIQLLSSGQNKALS